MVLGLIAILSVIAPLADSARLDDYAPASTLTTPEVQISFVEPRSADRKNPYRDLFAISPHFRDPRAARVPHGLAAASPRVVCGLQIWEVDPDVDPGIHLPVPDRRADFKIQRIVPPVCRG
jgi:hypothetical protein